jgi:hypothetical protein
MLNSFDRNCADIIDKKIYNLKMLHSDDNDDDCDDDDGDDDDDHRSLTTTATFLCSICLLLQHFKFICQVCQNYNAFRYLLEYFKKWYCLRRLRTNILLRFVYNTHIISK